jgi:hypothetical protein
VEDEAALLKLYALITNDLIDTPGSYRTGRIRLRASASSA